MITLLLRLPKDVIVIVTDTALITFHLLTRFSLMSLRIKQGFARV
jgi:hypothetical protein